MRPSAPGHPRGWPGSWGLAGLVAALVAFSPAQARATPVLEATRSVHLQVTADLGNPFHFNHWLPELNVLADPTASEGIRLTQGRFDRHLLRWGPYRLWAEGPLPTVATAEAWFAGGGVRLVGPPLAWPGLVDPDNEIIAWPPSGRPWALSWLDGVLARRSDVSGHRVAPGQLWRAQGAEGSPLWIWGAVTEPPSPSALREARRWRWSMRGWAEVAGPQGSGRLLGFPGPFGLAAVRPLARELAPPGVIRVDLGNAVGRWSDPEGPEGVAASLEALPAWGLDALVPDEDELALPWEHWEALASRVPLVACNLQAPPGRRALRPWRLIERGGIQVAVVGLADEAYLRLRGQVGGPQGWRTLPPEEAFAQAAAEAVASGADVVVLASTWPLRALAERRWDAPRCVAILSGDRSPQEAWVEGRVRPLSPWEDGRQAWGTWSANGTRILDLGLELAPARRRPGWWPREIRSQLRLARAEAIQGQEARRALALASWRGQALSEREDPALREEVLPSTQELWPGGPLQYPEESRLRLGASLLRQALGTEVALLGRRGTSFDWVGRIPAAVLTKWWRHPDPVGILWLQGDQLRTLLGLAPPHLPWILAGVEAQGHLVGGRPLEPTAWYRVATTEELAQGALVAGLFPPGQRPRFELARREAGPWRAWLPALPEGLRPFRGEGLLWREVGLAQLRADRAGLGGFGPAFAARIRAHAEDEGQALQPRLRVGLRGIQGSFQQLRGLQREAFGEVRNATVQAPEASTLATEGQAFARWEVGSWAWLEELEWGYARIQLFQGAQASQEPQDQLRLNSEWQGQRWPLGGGWGELRPYLGALGLTEFTPGQGPEGQPLPWRREINGTAGWVWQGTGLWEECKLGLLLEQDFAARRGGQEPGMQWASRWSGPWGPGRWQARAELRHYFPTAEDGLDDLGSLAQGELSLSWPWWGPLSWKAGLQAAAFRGKLPETSAWGATLTPSLGLSLDGAWTPWLGRLP